MGIAATLLLIFAAAPLVNLGYRQLHGASMVYWIFSWVGQTFAFPLALFSVVLLLVPIWQPGPGILVPVLLVLAAILYMVVHYRNHTMGRALLKQLALELPLEPAERESLLQYRAPRLSGLNPLRVRRPGVERLVDIAYGPHGTRNQLDIYRPESPPAEPMPILIQIHGGAWVMGQKDNQGLPLMYHLAANGFMCVAINYRLAPGDRFPAMLSDVLHAITWVKQHAHEYGGDRDFLALTGGSAGGHLSALAALVAGREGVHSEFPAERANIAAVIPLYGRYDFLNRHGVWGRGGHKLTRFKTDKVMPGAPEEQPELWELASPIDQLRDEVPPIFLLHGTHDSLISIEEARHFADALHKVSRGAGVHQSAQNNGPPFLDGGVIFAELTGAQHAFDFLMTPLSHYFARAVQYYLEYQRTRVSPAATAAVSGDSTAVPGGEFIETTATRREEVYCGD